MVMVFMNNMVCYFAGNCVFLLVFRDIISLVRKIGYSNAVLVLHDLRQSGTHETIHCTTLYAKKTISYLCLRK